MALVSLRCAGCVRLRVRRANLARQKRRPSLLWIHPYVITCPRNKKVQAEFQNIITMNPNIHSKKRMVQG